MNRIVLKKKKKYLYLDTTTFSEYLEYPLKFIETFFKKKNLNGFQDFQNKIKNLNILNDQDEFIQNSNLVKKPDYTIDQKKYVSLINNTRKIAGGMNKLKNLFLELDALIDYQKIPKETLEKNGFWTSNNQTIDEQLFFLLHRGYLFSDVLVNDFLALEPQLEIVSLDLSKTVQGKEAFVIFVSTAELEGFVLPYHPSSTSNLGALHQAKSFTTPEKAAEYAKEKHLDHFQIVKCSYTLEKVMKTYGNPSNDINQILSEKEKNEFTLDSLQQTIATYEKLLKDNHIQLPQRNIAKKL